MFMNKFFMLVVLFHIVNIGLIIFDLPDFIQVVFLGFFLASIFWLIIWQEFKGMDRVLFGSLLESLKEDKNWYVDYGGAKTICHPIGLEIWAATMPILDYSFFSPAECKNSKDFQLNFSQKFRMHKPIKEIIKRDYPNKESLKKQVSNVLKNNLRKEDGNE